MFHVGVWTRVKASGGFPKEGKWFDLVGFTRIWFDLV
jgi:hypothetical protein